MDPHYVPKTKRQRSIVDIVYDMLVRQWAAAHKNKFYTGQTSAARR